MTADDLRGRPAALIVGHPGHELRVHRWLELARPTVHVITDGSGRTGRSRLPSTDTVLARTGASRGAVFGVWSDAAIYRILLEGDGSPVLALVNTLAESLAGVDYVVADALEGFNPSHDLCRLIVNAAIDRAARRTGRALGNYDVLLDGDPRDCPEHLRADAVQLRLDDDDLARKIDAALGYAELRGETERALAAFGRDAFRIETLRPVRDPREGVDGLAEDPPYYERYGAQQVAAGHYDDVIRYRAHVQPIARLLWRDAAAAGGAHVTVSGTSA
jgi:hypothetical protein